MKWGLFICWRWFGRFLPPYFSLICFCGFVRLLQEFSYSTQWSGSCISAQTGYRNRYLLWTCPGISDWGRQWSHWSVISVPCKVIPVLTVLYSCRVQLFFQLFTNSFPTGMPGMPGCHFGEYLVWTLLPFRAIGFLRLLFLLERCWWSVFGPTSSAFLAWALYLFFSSLNIGKRQKHLAKAQSGKL